MSVHPFVLVRPAALEHGLRATILALLAPVGTDRTPRLVPNESRGAETEPMSGRQETPADVDVVAGDAELGTKPANLLERPLAERHVAARDVLGLPVGDQHVNRGARRVGEAADDRRAGGRRHVRAADAGIAGALEGGGDV